MMACIIRYSVCWTLATGQLRTDRFPSWRVESAATGRNGLQAEQKGRGEEQGGKLTMCDLSAEPVHRRD